MNLWATLYFTVLNLSVWCCCYVSIILLQEVMIRYFLSFIIFIQIGTLHFFLVYMYSCLCPGWVPWWYGNSKFYWFCIWQDICIQQYWGGAVEPPFEIRRRQMLYPFRLNYNCPTSASTWRHTRFHLRKSSTSTHQQLTHLCLSSFRTWYSCLCLTIEI